MTLEQDIQFALEHDEAIEYKQYENEILADIAIENIEFESVVLTNCKFMNCNFERVSSVSYTHLDVYKRQTPAIGKPRKRSVFRQYGTRCVLCSYCKK